MGLLKYCIKNQNVVILILIMLLIWGLVTYTKLSKREDPDIKAPTAVIVTLYPGSDPEKVENLITIPIEKAIDTIDEISDIKSLSQPGFSIIYAEITEEENYDNDKIWTKVRQEISKVTSKLPSNIYGPIVNDKYSDTGALFISLSGSSFTPHQLRMYAKNIKDQLVNLENVGSVEMFGEQTEIVSIEGSIKRFSEYNLKLNNVIEAIKAKNILLSGGSIKLEKSQIDVQPTGEFKSINEIEDVIIGVSPSNNNPIYLKDIFKVNRTYQDPPTYICTANGQEAVLLVVYMKKGKNVIVLGKEVDECFNSKLKNLLPADLHYDILSDQPTSVTKREYDFLENLITGVLLVILVSFVVFGFKTGLVISLSLPISMITTFGIMPMLHVDIEQVSIAALIMAIGMVVDDTIVSSENVHRYMDMGYKPLEAAFKGISELVVPIFTTTLTTIAAFLPMLLITGVISDFIRSLPIVMCVSLMLSFLYATLAAPGLTALLAGKKPVEHKNPDNDDIHGVFGKIVSVYKNILLFALNHKKVVLISAFCIFIGSVLMIPLIGVQFFPQAEKNQFLVTVRTPEGSNITTTHNVSKEVEFYLKKEPLVTSYLNVVGRGMLRFYYNIMPEVHSSNLSEILVNTKDFEATNELVTKFKDLFRKEIAGGIVSVKKLEQGKSTEGGPVAFRVTGNDYETIRSQAEIIKELMYEEPGTIYVQDDVGQDYFQFKVDIDQQKANRLGITNYETALNLLANLSGLTISSYREEDDLYSIVIRSPENERNSFEDIKHLLINSQTTGRSVYLEQIADIKPCWQIPQIRRKNLTRTILVSCYVDNRLPNDITNSIYNKILEHPSLKNANIEITGEEKERAKTFGQLTGVSIISFFMILFVLAFEFKSLSTAIIIIMSLPLALFGVVLGLVISGNPFGFMPFLGLVSLLGIVVKNAIIFIDFIKIGYKETGTLREGIVQAGCKRLRPIALTTTCTIFGLIPLAINGGTLFTAMAWVIMLGLLVSTFLTLVVIPTIYEIASKYVNLKYDEEEL